jgi:hypothetical protein
MEMIFILLEDFMKDIGMLVKAVNNDGFFPPPWNIDDYPEKTEGWLEFQRCMRNEPEYYLIPKRLK